MVRRRRFARSLVIALGILAALPLHAQQVRVPTPDQSSAILDRATAYVVGYVKALSSVAKRDTCR